MSDQLVAAREPGVVTEEASASMLDAIIEQSKVAQSDDEHARAKASIEELVHEVMKGTVVVSDNLAASLDARIAELDSLISDQLSEIMHAPEFQSLESTWRGLQYLCNQSETSEQLKIKVFNVTKRELNRDFERNRGLFDQSLMFKKVYEEEFGTFGGDPFGVLLGNFEISRQPEDIMFIDQMSHVAAAAHAPFIAAAAPGLLGLQSYAELSNPTDLAKVFSGIDYIKWRSFRESEDSRYVGLVMPRFLGRLPYDPKEGLTTDNFNFVEDVDGKDHEKYLWCNSVWALGARLTNAFSLYGWCAAIRGVEGGGLVEDLPTHTFATDDGDIALKCPTEISITDRREKELSDLGLIPLVHCKNKDYAAFFATQSAQKAAKYDKDSANANAILSTQLQYIFAVCRIAHYLKTIVREKIGSFSSAENVQSYLERWIAQYVLLNDDATQEQKAAKPLREAKIQVTEDKARPGCYKAVAFLRPHYQLDELTVSLRLVAELPGSAKK